MMMTTMMMMTSSFLIIIVIGRIGLKSFETIMNFCYPIQFNLALKPFVHLHISNIHAYIFLKPVYAHEKGKKEHKAQPHPFDSFYFITLNEIHLFNLLLLLSLLFSIRPKSAVLRTHIHTGAHDASHANTRTHPYIRRKI